MAKKECIVWFEECGSECTLLVGSKNANLGEMVRMGVPVPPGFAVTTAAYSEFMAQTGAARVIEQYLTKFPQGPKTPANYVEASQSISRIILVKDMPKETRNTIVSAYEELSQRCQIRDVPVAVRSSGVAEDLPTASFAGQYDSYLNVRGKDVLLDKVKSCWASLFTARAMAYRVKNNLPILGVSMSVGVQKMVIARCAGVSFSVHPGTGDNTKILIEGNWGTGESVVQGIALADRFVINKETCALDEKEINCKLKQVVIGETGTEEREVPETKRTLPCLSDEEAVKIAELVKAVEKSYGVPQDTEWALDDTLPFPQSIFLVQTRPITKVAEKKDAIGRILDMMLDRY